MHAYSAGAPDASCAAHHGEWGAWRCYLGQYAAPFLGSTTLLLQNQVDEWQGFMNGFFAYATDAKAFDYATWFRGETSALLRGNAAANENLYVFAPNCYHHGLSYDDIYFQVTVDKWTVASMLGALFDAAASPPPRVVLDDCAGLPCSPATSGHADCRPVDPPHLE